MKPSADWGELPGPPGLLQEVEQRLPELRGSRRGGGVSRTGPRVKRGGPDASLRSGKGSGPGSGVLRAVPEQSPRSALTWHSPHVPEVGAGAPRVLSVAANVTAALVVEAL